MSDNNFHVEVVRNETVTGYLFIDDDGKSVTIFADISTFTGMTGFTTARVEYLRGSFALPQEGPGLAIEDTSLRLIAADDFSDDCMPGGRKAYRIELHEGSQVLKAIQEDLANKMPAPVLWNQRIAKVVRVKLIGTCKSRGQED